MINPLLPDTLMELTFFTSLSYRVSTKAFSVTKPSLHKSAGTAFSLHISICLTQLLS